MLAEPSTHILLMDHISRIRIADFRVQIDTTIAQVITVVTEKPCALLDGVSRPTARRSRHIRHRQSLDGISASKLFAAHENMRVAVSPMNLTAVHRVHKSDSCLVDCDWQPRLNFIEGGKVIAGSSEFVVSGSEIIDKVITICTTSHQKILPMSFKAIRPLVVLPMRRGSFRRMNKHGTMLLRWPQSPGGHTDEKDVHRTK